MEGTVVRGRRCVVREEDDAADRWGRSASERERASERAGGWGWLVSERG
jgi:N-acetylglucosamine kinase-like BadF-type ATPase